MQYFHPPKITSKLKLNYITTTIQNHLKSSRSPTSKDSKKATHLSRLVEGVEMGKGLLPHPQPSVADKNQKGYQGPGGAP